MNILFWSIIPLICLIILFKKLFQRNNILNPKGRAVLITGCDSGFGYELALSLNSIGYRVYATVLYIDSIHKLLENTKNKDRMIAYKMDVTHEEDLKQVFLKVKHDLQTNECILWSVVNNAGYGVFGQLEWVDLAHYKQMFEVNLFGMIRVTKIFLPLLRISKGRIIILSSILGMECLNGYGPYCLTKYAVTAFGRTLRREMNKFNVQVIVIYPGGYRNTEFIKSIPISYDQIWSELDQNIKCEYSNEEYFEFWKIRQKIIFDYLMSDKSELVINDLIDSITNSEPKSEYKPIGWLLGDILYFVLPFIPNSLLDLLDSY